MHKPFDARHCQIYSPTWAVYAVGTVPGLRPRMLKVAGATHRGRPSGFALFLHLVVVPLWRSKPDERHYDKPGKNRSQILTAIAMKNRAGAVYTSIPPSWSPCRLAGQFGRDKSGGDPCSVLERIVRQREFGKRFERGRASRCSRIFQIWG